MAIFAPLDCFIYCVLGWFTHMVYKTWRNIYRDPLVKIPGPKLWASFRLPYVISLWRGRLVYGDIVRVAPNEVSFATEAAWDDIYCHRSGHSPFLKNPIWWGEVPGRAESIVSASTTKNHERLRRIIGSCFTDKAHVEAEPSVQQHVSKLIEKLTERVSGSKSGSYIVNIVDWYMFTTFDIIGDLGFGDSNAFGCLDNSTYHPWVLEIFSYFKLGALLSTIRFYDMLAQVIMRALPANMVKAQEKNYQWACQKVHRRLNLEVQRRDFMSKLLPHFSPDAGMGDETRKLSPTELENNFYVLTVAGSETCGTVLSGTTNYLIKTPDSLRSLTEEVRGAFQDPNMLTFESLSKLPYLNAVIKEGLRLSPPVGGALSHVVPEGVTLCVEFGSPVAYTNVGVHQWSLYRSATKFHKSTAFIPARWLEPALSDPESPYHADHRDAVQAFSTGTWACIGKQLGLAELRLILARMVWNFDLSLPVNGNNVVWEKQKHYVLVQKEGFDVELSMRSDLRG
ncbi:cytochrome P450 [Clohesyomyces aquaticus]|uniref:Cytochrome P450 n=1 Tax=Clohesyomyces aquaticus TaxID=1231657 RepID=A0A1Y1Y3B3_9PLEO|nr:cytochrome P450 [Clohesyomyces aquaticus]